MGLLSVLNYDKQRILALTSLKSVVQTSTDLKNQDLDSDFVKNNILDTKILSKYYIPDYLYNSKSKTYMYDPRLTHGIYLNHITQEYRKQNDLSKVKVPFSWYDWTDLGKHLNKLINLPTQFKPDCSYVCTNYFNKQLQRELEEKIRGTFEEKEELDSNAQAAAPPVKRRRRKATKYQTQKDSYCRDDNSESQPGFRIFKNHLKSKPDVKSLQSKSYLYSEASAPVSLVFLTNNGNLQVETIPNEGKENKQEFGLLNNKMVQNYIESFKSKHGRLADIYIDPQAEALEAFEAIGSLDVDAQPLPLSTFTIELNETQFEFNAPEYLKSSSPTTTSRHEANFQNSLKHSLMTKELLIEKYFSEVLLSRTRNHLQGGHFDWRFFSGELPEDEKKNILSRLLQNWFKLTTNAGLHSWIAHGNLLAYSYNGLNFPWDDDIDVQMPFSDLAKFAELYNGSLVIEDPEQGFGRYFIDVTSSLTHRLKGNGNNHIDARFIDIDTGLFIDITALAVSSSDTSKRFADRFDKLAQKGEEIKFKDPNYFDGVYLDVTKDSMRSLARENLELYKQLRQFERENINNHGKLLKDKSPEERYDINYKMQTYNCRNDHFVSLDELSPLKRSFFEKIPVFVPNNVSAILLDEYKPQRRLSAAFRGFTYLPQIRMWVSDGVLSNKIKDEDKRKNMNLLTESDFELLFEEEAILAEYYKTYDVTLIREKEKEIMNDESLEKKDELLSKLILGKTFPTLRKDLFTSRLEKEVAKKFSIQLDKEEIKSEMLSKLHAEYSKTIDYNTLGSGTPQEINFNDFGILYKDILKQVIENNYEPDFQIKKDELEQAVARAKNNLERGEKEKELNKLLDAEIQEKFDNNIPKPVLLSKGQVANVERPKNKPMDVEDDPGVVPGGHDQTRLDQKQPMKGDSPDSKPLPDLNVEVNQDQEAQKLEHIEELHKGGIS